MQIDVGDLVRVIADNADCGLGIVVEVQFDNSGMACRVLTSDNRCLYYFPFELHPPFPS